MDDIVIIGSDKEGIIYPKHLVQKFQKEELGKLCNFLGIEVVQSKGGLVKPQRKYALDILVAYQWIQVSNLYHTKESLIQILRGTNT